MSAVESRAKLIQAGQKLMADWQQTREIWQDNQTRQFDKKYMAPLEASIRAAALGMERIGNALNSARYDCQDSSGQHL